MAIEETCDPPMVISHYLKTRAEVARARQARRAPCRSSPPRPRAPAQGCRRVIAPWNFPFAIGISDSIPALMAGNAIVLKPDNKTALSPLYGIELLERGGAAAAGCSRSSAVRGPDVGPTLIDNVNYVMFTGSTATGRVIGEQAGRNLIGCCLELGGKNPMIVLEDANLDEVVPGALFGPSATPARLHAHRADLPAGVELRRVHEPIRRRRTEALQGRARPTTSARTSARWSRRTTRTACSRTSTTPSPRVRRS